ncbi:hypothetical protein Dimus_023955, partial [Dionaea muscipula]
SYHIISTVHMIYAYEQQHVNVQQHERMHGRLDEGCCCMMGQIIPSVEMDARAVERSWSNMQTKE